MSDEEERWGPPLRRWRYCDAYHADAGGYEVIAADDTDDAREQALAMADAEAAEQADVLWREWREESWTAEEEERDGRVWMPNPGSAARAVLTVQTEATFAEIDADDDEIGPEETVVGKATKAAGDRMVARKKVLWADSGTAYDDRTEYSRTVYEAPRVRVRRAAPAADRSDPGHSH